MRLEARVLRAVSGRSNGGRAEDIGSPLQVGRESCQESRVRRSRARNTLINTIPLFGNKMKLSFDLTKFLNSLKRVLKARLFFDLDHCYPFL